MPAFQIVVESRQRAAARSPRDRLAAKGVVDVLVDGANLTARLGDAEVVPLLRDLASAASDLACGRHERVGVRCLGGDGGWELGLERAGADALLTLFRGGVSPEVAVFERRVGGAALLAGLADALGELATETTEAASRELLALEGALRGQSWPDADDERARTTLSIDAGADAPIRFRADVSLRGALVPELDAEDDEDELERSDLFSLLGRGTFGVAVGDRERSVPDVFPFLVAERLVEMAREVLDAWEGGRALHRRVDAAGVLVAARLPSGRTDGPVVDMRGRQAPDGERGLWLTVGGPRGGGVRGAWTFPSLEVPAFVQGVVAFARELCRAYATHVRGASQNLRVSTLRGAALELDDRLCDAVRDDSRLNARPESYRAFAAMLRRPDPEPAPLTAAKIRYAPRWAAVVPHLDLRGTFLCGDRVIVGGDREIACLDRGTGAALWKTQAPRATSVVTPGGVARLHVDGTLALHDFGTGEISLRMRLAPRPGGSPSGAVVNAPGLPRLLIVTEGERWLTAIDLGAGETRWRYATRRGDSVRVRRAGRLVVVGSGDGTLSALDAASGELVWRVRDRLRFALPIGLDHESIFAIAGDPSLVPHGTMRLYHLDPYSGETRWTYDLPRGVVPFGGPLLGRDEVVVVTRDRHGLGLLALDRATAAIKWSKEPGFAPVSSAWLVVDRHLVLNSGAGTLLALSLDDGALSWRHVFEAGAICDQPRRLEPILRSGALFVPQHDVHVVRPRDGEIIGRIETDVIPDLLRVDERCDVYVAEESGHIAAFGAGPRLSLVKA